MMKKQLQQQEPNNQELPDKDAIPLPQECSKGSTSTSTPTQLQPTKTPEHPYRLAKDAAYSPPVTKNIGAQDKPATSNTKKPKPAYKTLSPIHDP
jgi:hypothetical protein